MSSNTRRAAPGSGDRISEALRAAGYRKDGRPDVARFCAHFGYRPQYVYAWLKGRTPGYENLQRLAGDLGVTATWIMFGEPAQSQARAVSDAGRGGSRQRARTHAPTHLSAPPAPPALKVLDFARLREATSRLLEIEAQLTSIVLAFPDLYFWVDARGVILDAKLDGAALGAPAAEFVGKPLAQAFPTPIATQLLEAVTFAFHTGSVTAVEYGLPIGSARRHHEARVVPLDAAAFPDGKALIVIRDISYRAAAESALRDSEARYRALVEGSIEGICITQDEVIRFANQAYADILGCSSPEDVVGRPTADFAAPHDRDRIAGYRAARLKGEPAPTRYTFEGRRADGAPVWIEIVVSVIAWEARPAVLATLKDITEPHRAQEVAEALAEAGRELASTLDLNELVERIVGRLTRLLRVGRAQIFSVVPETQALRCIASAGAGDVAAVLGREFPAGQGVVGHAVNLGKAVATMDAINDPDIVLPEWATAFLRGHGFIAVMAVPLVARGRVIGALAVADRPGRIFTESESALIESFADHAAVALDNARRYHELEQRLAALTARGQG